MEIGAKVRSFILENFYVGEGEPLSDNDSLISRGIVDSTGMLEVIAFLEQEFGFVVKDDETVPENLDSIGRITDFIARKQRMRSVG